MDPPTRRRSPAGFGWMQKFDTQFSEGSRGGPTTEKGMVSNWKGKHTKPTRALCPA